MYINAVGYGVITYPKIFQCWRRSLTCTCTIAQFRCSKLPLKFLHAKFFLFLGIEFWIHGLRESEFLVLKHTHASKKNTWNQTHLLRPLSHMRESRKCLQDCHTKALVISDFVKPLQLHGF